MISLINQWYHRKLLPHYSRPKKLKESFLTKKKSQRSCWVKKGKTDALLENFSNSKVPESI